jgi:ArsR family transcriptional regulator
MDYQKYSDLLKVLGHPVRLKIVEGLIKHQCNVKNMVAELNIPQSTVSQHLSILRARGILAVEKDGVSCCYRVVDNKVRKIIDILKK